MIAVIFLQFPRYFSLIFPKFSQNVSNIFSKFIWIFKIIFSDISSCIQKFFYHLLSKCSKIKKNFWNNSQSSPQQTSGFSNFFFWNFSKKFPKFTITLLKTFFRKYFTLFSEKLLENIGNIPKFFEMIFEHCRYNFFNYFMK